MQNNLITSVPAGSLPANLTQISFTSNPLTIIDSNAFNESITTLESLAFSEARFSRISDAFLHLRALKQLSILDSEVEDWNENAMKNIALTVETLSLENVGFTSWPTWIQYFTHLTELSVTGSSINSIPDDALVKLAKILRSLNLNDNSLSEVPKTLSKLTALQMISLEQNKIVDVTWLPQSRNLSFLSLHHNSIQNANELSSALRLYADSLYDLQLSENKLTSIPNLSFLSHIGSLNFTSNLISDPYSGTLPPGLYELDLGYNSLTTIPRIMWTLKSVTDFVFTSNAIDEIQGIDITPWTTALELGFNVITALTDTSFPMNSSISALRLNNNPLTQISTEAFKNLPRLDELNIQYTKITRLPLGLSLLKGYVLFDVTGSDDLVCTCSEKSLEPWILFQSRGNIIGNCGQMSIYDFFKTLSPGCPVQQ